MRQPATVRPNEEYIRQQPCMPYPTGQFPVGDFQLNRQSSWQPSWPPQQQPLHQVLPTQTETEQQPLQQPSQQPLQQPPPQNQHVSAQLAGLKPLPRPGNTQALSVQVENVNTPQTSQPGLQLLSEVARQPLEPIMTEKTAQTQEQQQQASGQAEKQPQQQEPAQPERQVSKEKESAHGMLKARFHPYMYGKHLNKRSPKSPKAAALFKEVQELVLTRSPRLLGVQKNTYEPRPLTLDRVQELQERGKRMLIPLQYTKRHVSRITAGAYVGAHDILRKTAYHKGLFAPIDKTFAQPFLPPIDVNHPLITSRKGEACIVVRLLNIKNGDNVWLARAAVAALFTLTTRDVLIDGPGEQNGITYVDFRVYPKLDWKAKIQEECFQACFTIEEWLAQTKAWEAGCLEELKIRNLAVTDLPDTPPKYKGWLELGYTPLDYNLIRPAAEDKVYTQVLSTEQDGFRPIAHFDQMADALMY